ncbi:MAG: MCE family protein [Flavobacteriales bacterium]|nr:MCE family protein [Flavobacteriales bacterium]MCB9191971.1 MCE family protein [Flavobacteriales bacterium]MCB9204991.1 MCE family protein [Flavobacteriales bacterium]
MKYSKELRTGFIAVATIFGFVWGYNFLKGNDIFSKQRIFYTTYANVGGLTQSNAVMVNGYKVGLVKDVYFDPSRQDRLIVEIMLTADNYHIPRGTKATLVSDLLGTPSINLITGNEGGYHEEGDTLVSEIEGALMESITDLSSSLATTKVKADRLFESLDSLVNDIRDVLGKGERDSDVNRAFRDLAQTMDNLESATSKIDGILDEDGKLGKILADVEGFTSTLDENKDEIDNLLNNLSSFSDSLAAAELASTINNANKALAELSEAIEKINKGEGTIGKLFQDETVYSNLEAATRNLDSLFIDIKANPNRYVHVSVFGRKEKKDKKKK